MARAVWTYAPLSRVEAERSLDEARYAQEAFGCAPSDDYWLEVMFMNAAAGMLRAAAREAEMRASRFAPALDETHTVAAAQESPRTCDTGFPPATATASVELAGCLVTAPNAPGIAA